MKTKNKMMQGLCLAGLLFSATVANACDLSGFKLNNVTSLGNNQYKLDVTFCAGNGRSSTRYGADQGTSNFAFYLSKNASLYSWSDDSLISPVTGAKFYAYHHIDSSKYSVKYKAHVLYYINENYANWTCINYSCGAVSSVCKSISIYTTGLPDTVWCRGMEAAGNIVGGCTNLKVFPRCFFSTLTANAGSDKQVYKGYSPTCATLSGSATGGAGSYTYSWSTAATTSSINVCPTATTTYSLIVTDLYGCRDTDQVIVNWKDVRCGNNLTKVQVCYQGSNYCVSSSNVNWYTSRGGTLGSCGSLAMLPTSAAEELNPEIVLFPNPASTEASVQFTGTGNPYTIKITDITGKVMENLSTPACGEGRSEIFSLNIQQYHSGIYFIHIEGKNVSGENFGRDLSLVVK